MSQSTDPIRGTSEALLYSLGLLTIKFCKKTGTSCNKEIETRTGSELVQKFQCL